MNIDKLLEYQKKDFEIIKLERAINSSANKKALIKMIETSKSAQTKSNELENRAGNLIKEYESLKATYEQNSKSLENLLKKDLEKLTETEILNSEDLLNKISNNLNVLEKKITACAENVNIILTEFEKTKKLYNSAREKHAEYKKLFEEENSKVEPVIKKIQAELKVLEKEVDATLLGKYKTKRQDKIFPIFVPLSEKSCGGCHMELPSAVVSKLQENGFLECENCRRIIYFKK